MPVKKEYSGFLILQATSAGFDGGNLAKITINDVAVELNQNESCHDRGLHVAIINPLSGILESAKVFDTYAKPNGFDSFIAGNDIPKGSLVVAACKDECSTGLSQ